MISVMGLFGEPAIAEITYNYTTLPDVPGAMYVNTFSGISGRNIVGTYTDSNGQHGFLYDGTNYHTLDVPPAFGANATAVNGIDGSNIVGVYGVNSPGLGAGAGYGFLFNGTKYQTFEAPGTTPDESVTYFQGISGGTILGSYWDAVSGVSGIFLYNGTNYEPLEIPLPIDATAVLGISGGTIVGYYYESNSAWQGFLYNYNSKSFQLLNVPGATLTLASGISGSNIVGSYLDSSSGAHGFLYNGTNYQTLNVPGATATSANAIDGSNIVGVYSDSRGAMHGFLATPSATQPLQITTTTLPNATNFVSYNTPPVVLQATGGTGTGYRWSVLGSLPAGFNLDQNTGVLSSDGCQVTPAGSYNLTFQVTDSAGTSSPTRQLTLVVSCPTPQLTLKPWGAYMQASFTTPSWPNGCSNSSNPSLTDYASACGFAYLDWQQFITTLPGSHVEPNTPLDLILSGNVVYKDPSTGLIGTPLPTDCFPWNSNCYVVAGFAPACGNSPGTGGGEAPSLYDPPQGGWVIPPPANTCTSSRVADHYPFYYQLAAPSYLSTICTAPPDPNQNCNQRCPGLFPYIVSPDLKTLSFVDEPCDRLLPGDLPSTYPPPGHFQAFQTSLVGIDGQGNIMNTLHSWTWNSTFNGWNGGGTTVISQTEFNVAVDPGSGSGGVTVTNINGVQLPSVVSSSQVTTTASGLAYSRVSKTFNGTVTVTNIGTSTISGPLQIVFFGMPPNVTLTNATGNLSGTPYVTISSVASLAPGQSTTISVKFANPSDVTLNLAPVIYSGSIN
jgi:hypothetical protein